MTREESIKNGATYRFLVQLNNFSSDKDLRKERERFNKNAFKGECGVVLLFTNTFSDIKQLKNDSYVVDSEQNNSLCILEVE